MKFQFSEDSKTFFRRLEDQYVETSKFARLLENFRTRFVSHSIIPANSDDTNDANYVFSVPVKR